MKRLLVLFIVLISTTISSMAISGDVAVTSTTGTSGSGAAFSWVIKNDDIFFALPMTGTEESFVV